MCVSISRQCGNKPACAIRAKDLPQCLLVIDVTDVQKGSTEDPFLRKETIARLESHSLCLGEELAAWH